MPVIESLPCDENKVITGSFDKAVIDDKVGFGIAVMNTRRKTEPYLQNGILYTNRNDNHIFAYYHIPQDTENNEIISPIFTVLGEDMDDCLREVSRSLKEWGEKKTKWEIFAIDSDDLGKITSKLGKDVYRKGLSVSIHRTPVTYIAEHYQPAPERTDRKQELEVLKRDILQRHGIDPDKSGE